MSECQQIQDWLAEFALDADNCPIAERIREHLDVCEACGAQVRELKEAWSDVAETLPGIEPTQEFTSRVLSLAFNPAASQETDSFGKNEPNLRPNESSRDLEAPRQFGEVRAENEANLKRRPKSRWAVPLNVAAGILIFVSVAWLLASRNSKEPLKPDVAINDWSREVLSDGATTETYLVSLVRLGSDTPVPAHILCDTKMRKAHLVLFGLSPLERESLYCVWLLDTSDGVLASSALELSQGGIGKALIDLPADVGRASRIVVSREGRPDAPKPSDEIVVAGTFEIFKGARSDRPAP